MPETYRVGRVIGQGQGISIDTELDPEVRAIVLAKQRALDYRIAFSTDSGRRVLGDLRDFCFHRQETFAVDPYVSAYNQGRRRVLLRIENSMNMDDAGIEAAAKAHLDQTREN